MAASLLVLPLLAFTGQDQDDVFRKLVADASTARQANDLTRAADLYQQALLANPKWEEGWWSLGSVLYDANQYEKAAGALAKLVSLNPKAAPGWGLLGLCEFEIGADDRALADIQRALALGLPGQDQMEGVLRYHEALVLTHTRDFDTALQKYSWFVQRGVQHDTLLISLGLAALRNPIYPEAIAPDQREVTLAAGRAALLSLSGQTAQAILAFHDLAEKYPTTPGVHYLYGTLLTSSDPEKAKSEMLHELEVSPSNGAANATVAWMLMEDDDLSGARPLAQKSIQEEPKLALAQYVYGRCLVDEGKIAEGIEHLETAVRMSPAVLIHHIALAAAYSKAGRPEDARRERNIAMKLAKEDRAAVTP